MPLEYPRDPMLRVGWVNERVESLKTAFRTRNEAWRFDRALLNQSYRTNDPGFPLILSPEPRNQFRLALDIMSLRDPRFTIMISDQTADEQDRMNDAEKFAVGIWRESDHRWRRGGNRSLLRDINFYSLSGGHALFCLVSKGMNGETEFRIIPWDPIEVFPEFTEEGLVFVARVYKTSAQDIRERAARNKGWNAAVLESLKSADEVEVSNSFWLEEDGVYNCLQVNGKEIKPPTYEPQFGSRLPVICIPASGQPFRDFPFGQGWGVDTKEGFDWRALAWEGFLAPMRLIAKDFDSLLTNMAIIVRNNARGKYIQRTRDGRPRINPQQFRNMELGTIQVGEDIFPLPPATSPHERQELLTYFSGAFQRAGLSHLAFGSLGVELSGVTVDSLINATQSVMAPFVESSEYALSEAILSLMEQFRKGSFKAVSLETRANKAAVGDRWFIKNFERADIPKTAFLEVTLPLALPDTKLARIQAYRAAMGDNRPMMSEQQATESLLADIVPDFWEDRKKRDSDVVRNSEEGATLARLFGLMDVYKTYQARAQETTDVAERDELLAKAEIIFTLMQSAIATYQQAIAGTQQRTPGIVAQREAQGTPITEPSPDAMPAEAGGVSPDQLRSIAGGVTAPNLLAKRAANMTNGNGNRNGG